MLFLIYFYLFTLTYTHKCSFKPSLNYEQIYLCREKLNLTSLRIWLHFKFNQTNLYELNFFSSYSFTLRTIDLLHTHHINFKDRFEKQISNYTEINTYQKQNNTIIIHDLSPGRYEICVNFLNKKMKKFYYRSSNSCLHFPWNVPGHDRAKPNPGIRVLFIVLIIIFLISLAYVFHSIHQYIISRRPPVPSPVPIDAENADDDIDDSERARRLVDRHFSKDDNPFELMVRRRIHRRYAHDSPDLNDR